MSRYKEFRLLSFLLCTWIRVIYTISCHYIILYNIHHIIYVIEISGLKKYNNGTELFYMSYIINFNHLVNFIYTRDRDFN